MLPRRIQLMKKKPEVEKIVGLFIAIKDREYLTCYGMYSTLGWCEITLFAELQFAAV